MTSQLPADFVGGLAFKNISAWKQIMDQNSFHGVIPPSPIRHMIETGGLNILHRSLIDPRADLVFNGKKFDDLPSLQASRPAGFNYQSFAKLPIAETQSILVDLVTKKVIRKLTPQEVSSATFSPLGYVQKDIPGEAPKTRITFHWLRNSQYQKSPLSLANLIESGEALSKVAEGYIVDLKSCYWQMPLDHASALSCGFAVNDELGDLVHYCFCVLPFGCSFGLGRTYFLIYYCGP